MRFKNAAEIQLVRSPVSPWKLAKLFEDMRIEMKTEAVTIILPSILAVKDAQAILYKIRAEGTFNENQVSTSTRPALQLNAL